jgi:hypothetical protein
MGMFDNLDNQPSKPTPQKKSSGDIDWKAELLSWKGTVGVVVLLGAGWLIFGGSEPDRNEVVNYSNSNVPIGVSDTLNKEAVNQLGVDLTDNLDPKLVPVVVAEAMKEVTEAGVSEADFIPSLVSKISNKISDISTIDLNADGLADPILVIPASASSDQEFIQFSIKVPDPAEVSELPPGSDQGAWRDIAENKSIEIMTTSATKNAKDELSMQSAPNPQMYNSSPAPYYHYSSPGLGSILMTSMMMSALFSPPFMGYGGYNGGGPRNVSTVQSQRSGVTSSMASSSPSQSTVKNSKGQSVGQSNFKKIPPKSLNQVKTAQFRSKNNAAKANRSGGFGSAKKSSSSSTVQKPRVSAPRRAMPRRRSGGFGRRRR